MMLPPPVASRDRTNGAGNHSGVGGGNYMSAETTSRGRALLSGGRGRRFKSSHSDQRFPWKSKYTGLPQRRSEREPTQNMC